MCRHCRNDRAAQPRQPTTPHCYPPRRPRLRLRPRRLLACCSLPAPHFAATPLLSSPHSTCSCHVASAGPASRLDAGYAGMRSCAAQLPHPLAPPAPPRPGPQPSGAVERGWSAGGAGRGRARRARHAQHPLQCHAAAGLPRVGGGHLERPAGRCWGWAGAVRVQQCREVPGYRAAAGSTAAHVSAHTPCAGEQCTFPATDANPISIAVVHRLQPPPHTRMRTHACREVRRLHCAVPSGRRPHTERPHQVPVGGAQPLTHEARRGQRHVSAAAAVSHGRLWGERPASHRPICVRPEAWQPPCAADSSHLLLLPTGMAQPVPAWPTSTPPHVATACCARFPAWPAPTQHAPAASPLARSFRLLNVPPSAPYLQPPFIPPCLQLPPAQHAARRALRTGPQRAAIPIHRRLERARCRGAAQLADAGAPVADGRARVSVHMRGLPGRGGAWMNVPVQGDPSRRPGKEQVVTPAATLAAVPAAVGAHSLPAGCPASQAPTPAPRSEVTVQWATRDAGSRPSVRWGAWPGALDTTAAGRSSTYSRGDMCGPPANTTGWFDPGWLHAAVMAGLQPSTRYFYQYGDEVRVPLLYCNAWVTQRPHPGHER